jgi:heat shock protein HslJ
MEVVMEPYAHHPQPADRRARRSPRRRPLVALLAVAATTLVLAACGGGDGTSGDDGETAGGEDGPAGQWVLTDGVGPEGAVTVPDQTDVTLLVEVADGGTASIGGLAACNSYGGEVTLDGIRAGTGSWTGGTYAVTEMLCVDEAVMAAERSYLAALEGVTAWTRADDGLTLTGDGIELAFRAVPPAPTEELVDTTWVLDGLVTGRGEDAAVASPVRSDEPALLRLAADGSLTASTGCRSFEGEWIASGAQVVFPSFGQTPDSPNVGADGTPTCDDALRSQEDHVLSVLGDGFVPTIEGDRLTLTSGSLGLVYVATSSG